MQMLVIYSKNIIVKLIITAQLVDGCHSSVKV